MNNDNDLNLHSMTKLSGWLRYWGSYSLYIIYNFYFVKFLTPVEALLRFKDRVSVRLAFRFKIWFRIKVSVRWKNFDLEIIKQYT